MSPTISLFSLSQLIYWFLLYYPSGEPSIAALVVKCLPVAALALSVYLEIEANEPMKEEGSKVNHTKLKIKEPKNRFSSIFSKILCVMISESKMHHDGAALVRRSRRLPGVPHLI